MFNKKSRGLLKIIFCFLFTERITKSIINLNKSRVGDIVIGRKKELSLLDSLYNSNDLKIVLLQGVRGIGKTSILKEFLKHKRAAYFVFRSSSDSLNQAAFSLETTTQGFGTTDIFSWEKNLENMVKISTGEKIILALDNADELYDKFQEFIPKLKSILAEIIQDKRLLIIFSGRRIDFFKDRFLEYKNRITSINIKSLRYNEVTNYLNDMDNEDKVILYGITNGEPRYLKLIDQQKNFKENIKDLFFHENSLLLNFGEEEFNDNLRQPSIYNAIMCSIACNDIHMKDIALTVNMSANKVSKYISILLELGYLEKITLIEKNNTLKKSKNTFYKITNNTLLFWYKFVYPYLSTITIGMGNYIFRHKVVPYLNEYMQQVFLDVCYQHCLVLKERANFSIDFKKIGFIWDKGCNFAEISLRAYDNYNNVCHIKCIWDKSKVTCNTVNEFKSKFFDDSCMKNYYLIFSRKGFSEQLLVDESKDKFLRLISLRYLK